MRVQATKLSAVALALMTSVSAAGAVESSDPIKLTLHDWSGQLINTKIMGSILTEAGYNVEYVQADYIAQFAGLKNGDLHLAMEIWETTGREALDEATGTGKVVNVGETGLMAIEEWWYPSYMKDLCPGLPNWEALKDCAEEFSTPETAPNGRYVGGPVTWGGFDEERVEALELEFEVVHAGTDAALFAELESAYQRKDPIMLWVYVPHWAPAKYDGEFVEFPPYSAEC
jgi:glycine betaine/proline transport system substrate-binding protein